VCAVPSGHVTGALAELGVEAAVLSLDPRSLDDVIACIEAVARAAGAERAGAGLAAALRARLAATARTVPGEPPAVLALEWADPPWVAGHWVPEMVALAGGRDVLGAPSMPSRRVTWDEIAAADPDLVAFVPCGFGLAAAAEQGRSLLAEPRFASLRAVRKGRAFALDGSAYFSRPGPRLIDGVEALAGLLAGEPDGRAVPITAG
jgi:iron complex transport system substrate-binding protein